MKDIEAAFDELERRIMAYAYASYAALVRDAFRSGFGAFVSILPARTGLTQSNATVTSKDVKVTGNVRRTSLGSSGPVLGWTKRPRVVNAGHSRFVTQPGRVADPLQLTADRASVDVHVQMPDTYQLAVNFMRQGTTKVTGYFRASRSAYDEPDMHLFMSSYNLGDYDVLAWHTETLVMLADGVMLREYKRRSQFQPPKPDVIKRLVGSGS